MRLLHSVNVLDGALNRALPFGTLKELVIRFAGTNVGGQAITLAQMGRVRVNFNGTDTVNDTFSFMNAYDNLIGGVAEFSSAVGGAFAGTIIVPFHAWWDANAGMFNSKDVNAYIDMTFGGLAGIVASGTVQVSFIEANQVASYVTKFIQQNIQAGGAGMATQFMVGRNFSSLFLEENGQLTTVQVSVDGQSRITSDQATLKAYSNWLHEIETAITVIDVNLNPFNKVNIQNESVQVNALVGAATTLGIHTLSFDQSLIAVRDSQAFYQARQNGIIAADLAQ